MIDSSFVKCFVGPFVGSYLWIYGMSDLRELRCYSVSENVVSSTRGQSSFTQMTDDTGSEPALWKCICAWRPLR